MSVGGKTMEKDARPLATARVDRESTAGDGNSRIFSRTGISSDWTTIWRIPVGYQDETGFHCGEPPLKEIARVADIEASRTSSYNF